MQSYTKNTPREMTTMAYTTSNLLEILVAFMFFSILTMFVKTFFKHVFSKPPVNISMVDLINVDLVRTYYATLNVSMIIFTITSLSLDDVPSCIAAIIAFAFSVAGICFATYISISVIVHYVMIRQLTINFSAHLTDEQVINAIRFVVITPVVILCTTLGIIEGPGKTFTLYYPITGQYETEQELGLPSCAKISLFMAALGVIINSSLRILISREKRKTRSCILEQKTPHYNAYILVFVILMCIAVSMLIPFQMRRLVIFFTLCVALPGFFFSRNDKLSGLLWKTLLEKYPFSLLKRCSSRISPTNDIL